MSKKVSLHQHQNGRIFPVYFHKSFKELKLSWLSFRYFFLLITFAICGCFPGKFPCHDKPFPKENLVRGTEKMQ